MTPESGGMQKGTADSSIHLKSLRKINKKNSAMFQGEYYDYDD
jgi:hypothetical protein